MKHSWHSTDGILTVADVQQWCQWLFAGDCTAIEIDWQGIGTIEDIGAIAQLFSFLCESRFKEIEVHHLNHESNDQVVQIIDSYCQESLVQDHILIIPTVLPVNTTIEEKIDSEKINFIDFIPQEINGYKKDFCGLKNLFGELFMNICHHSDKQNSGYICVAQVDIKTNILNLAASDLGKGIPSALTKEYPEITNDNELIANAIIKGVTSKSRSINQGKGLDNVNSLVNSTNGHWQIYSGNGYFDSRTKTKYTPQIHIGTLVVIKVPLNNLPNASTDNFDYIDEINFNKL